MFCVFALCFSKVTEMTVQKYAQAKKIYIDSFVASYKRQKISLKDLAKKSWAEYAVALDSNFDKTVENPRNFCFVDLDPNGQVLGFIAARTDGNILYIAETSVRTDSQNKGISKRLISACIKRMKVSNCQKIKVTAFTRNGNKLVREIYVNKWGWKEYPNVQDAIKVGDIPESKISPSSEEDANHVVPWYDPEKYVFFIWSDAKKCLMKRLAKP
ncbi:MAG: GNAT family N-acetyltransferase [Pseudomonadota bacterium]